MRYHGMVIRPPSEADSWILQVTYGCSHNGCSFCPTYIDKPFRVRERAEVIEDIAEAASVMPGTRRVFLADGNALVLGQDRLKEILRALSGSFDRLQRVGIYANARDIASKSDHELEELRQMKLGILYLGLESGSDTVLRRAGKGATVEEMVEAVCRAQRAGIKASVIGLLGLGGRGLSTEHAVETGRVVARMSPRFFSLLTLMVVEGTPLHREQQSGGFELPTPWGMLQEARLVLQNIDGIGRCIFRSNHASNYLPLAGNLPKDRDRLVTMIDDALQAGHEGLRPEFLRGL